jgi:hypothetical protein
MIRGNGCFFVVVAAVATMLQHLCCTKCDEKRCVAAFVVAVAAVAIMMHVLQ